MEENENNNDEIEKALEKYENRGANGSGQVASVSRVGGQSRASAVLAEVDTKGVFKTDKAKELLVDLSARTNFRSRNERIYFLDWVDWCEEFGVGFEGPILYMSSARSEGGEGVQQLVDYYTRRDSHVYSQRPRGKEKTEEPVLG